MFAQNHTLLYGGLNKTESVELIFECLLEGCGMTRTKTNDTMPHTWIVWGYVRKMRTAT